MNTATTNGDEDSNQGEKSVRRLIKILLFLILSLPKTFYFNFRVFNFGTAIKIPWIVGFNTKLSELHRGIIRFSDNTDIRPGIVKFGYGGSRGIVSNRYSEICLQKGTLTIKGKAEFAEGCSLRLNGNLSIGNNFTANKNTFISCSCDDSFIGEDVLMGWNCSIRDSDGHSIIHDGVLKPAYKSVHIGNNCWICAESHILKGVNIGDNSVVAYRSTVTKGTEKNNVLLGGMPATIIQEGIEWER